MKKKHLIFISGLLFLFILLGLTGAAGAEAPGPSKSAAQYREEGCTVIELSDTVYGYEGFLALDKGVTYLKETVKGGISRSGNSFSLSGYTKTAANNGEDTQYCILSGGELYFGQRNSNSSGDTIILDEMQTLDAMAIITGVNEHTDESARESLMVLARYTLGAIINWPFDIHFNQTIEGVPLDIEGTGRVFLDCWNDTTSNSTKHTIQMYTEVDLSRVGLSSDKKTSASIKIPIIKYEKIVPIVSLKFGLDDFKGSLAFGIKSHGGVEFVFYTTGGAPSDFDDWSISQDKDSGVDGEISTMNASGDVSAGFLLGNEGTALTIFSTGITFEAGVLVTGTPATERFDPADTKDEWHICDDCLREDIKLFFGPLTLDVIVMGLEFDWEVVKRHDGKSLGNYYYSNTFAEGGKGKCPHWAWHTPTTVESSDHHDFLKDVSVSYTTVPSHCDPYASGKTGDDGSVDLYMPPGDYTIKAEAQSPLDPEWKISDELKYTKNDGDPYGALLTLDIPINYVYFKNSQTGTATDWPEDIRFSPFYRQDIQLPDKVPVLPGRQFIEWNTKEDGTGTAYAPGTTLTLDDDLTLWAQWQIAGDSWYVVYNAHGGTSAPSPDIVDIGSDAIVKEAAQSETMRFVGWSTDPEAAEAEYQPGDTLKYDSSRNVVILYALWQLNPPGRPWVLSFQDSLPDAVSGLPNSMSIDPSVSTDAIIPSDIPEKSGRLFTGWNTAQDGSGKDYAPGSTITLTGDTTLWAQWTLAENTWVLVYNANGGTDAPSPSVIRQDYIAIISIQEPSRRYMKFLGWALSPDATKAEYQPNDLFENTEGKPIVVLYALWEPTPGPAPIRLSFRANGVKGASIPPAVSLKKGEWYQLPYAVAPVGSGYVFLGWSEDPFATDPEYLAGKRYSFAYDTELNAVWSKQETVTLTFQDSLADSVSGIPDPITILPSMSPYVRIPSQIPQKSGRVFTGWNTAKDGTGTKYAPGSTITLTEDMTLWAQWDIAGNSWYILYDANGGTKAPGAQIVPQEQDAVLTKELPENGSLTFMGWATDPEAAAAEYQPGDTLKYDSGKSYVVLYALWELDPAQRPVTVSFDANGGLPDTAPKKITVPKGIWTQLPAQQPSWDAQHDFLGWSADPKATEPQWKAGSAVVINLDTTLYAIWNAHYKVIEGAGSVWTKGSGKTQRFVADGDVKYFKELRVDGLPFNEGVQISSGSTVADISAKAMEKLSVGDHTVTFVYIDGTASAPFKVRAKIPPTGDTGHPALWLTLVMLGIVGLILPGMLSRTARRKK